MAPQTYLFAQTFIILTFSMYKATSIVTPMFNVSVLDQKKSKNLMREGGKKIKKKNIEPIFEKTNEGDELKKTLDKFL